MGGKCGGKWAGNGREMYGKCKAPCERNRHARHSTLSEGEGDGTATSPISLKGDGMATYSLSMKRKGDGMAMGCHGIE